MKQWCDGHRLKQQRGFDEVVAKVEKGGQHPHDTLVRKDLAEGGVDLRARLSVQARGYRSAGTGERDLPSLRLRLECLDLRKHLNEPFARRLRGAMPVLVPRQTGSGIARQVLCIMYE